MTGLGQGAAFSLALVLLVRYARTPEASGRLTGMAFLISYGIASIGPVAMGLVRDVTGGLSLVWAVLAAIGGVQALVVLQAAPRPPPGRLNRPQRGRPWPRRECLQHHIWGSCCG